LGQIRRQEPFTSVKSSDWLTVDPLGHALHWAAHQIRPKRLLDIGCGNQPYRAWFPSVSYYVGCDVTSLNNLADLVAHADIGVPLSDRTFDTILCTQVLEHLIDPCTLFSESHRILEDDGWLILSAPMYWPHHEEPHDYYRFTRHGLQFMLTKFGFRVVRVIQQGGAWRVTGQALALSIDRALPHRTYGIKAGTMLILNRLFAWLDKVNYQEGDTTNFVVLAQKVHNG